MSITNADLITDSLRELGVIAETQSASAEQGAYGLRKLNQMMAEIQSAPELDLGYFEQSDLSAACPIAPEIASAITCLLAIRQATNYGATVSAELGASAEGGWTRLLRVAMNRNTPESDLSNRPRGSGHRRFGRILTDT